MTESSIKDRLTFLAEQFDVFNCESATLGGKKMPKVLEDKLNYLKQYGSSSLIKTSDGIILGIVTSKINEKNRPLKKISICSDVFAAMIAADPTDNKMYIQWMLNVFTRLIKEQTDSSVQMAIRFVQEDLPQANAYLRLFDENKRKKKFIDLCKASYGLKHITDPTNVNQYKTLSQLFDAIDPFIEKEPSAVERTLNKFVESGQAEIPVHDRKFTLYIPKTTAASVVFNKFANWCTAVEGNGMFKSYTEGQKKPNGKKSDIYIIINNKFFENKSDELYQIHFESKQLKDRKNGTNTTIFESVLCESEGMRNFFYDELMAMAKSFNKGIDNNFYLDFLIQFGFTESLFELIEKDTPLIKFMKREIPRLPDISRFQSIEEIVITDAQMTELHPSIGDLPKLRMISIPNNKIKTIPKEIGKLKNLSYFNIINNPIVDIPEEIGLLDRSNGGSLVRLSAKEEQIGAKNYQKLKRLLPKADII